jgi:hypothetical protein
VVPEEISGRIDDHLLNQHRQLPCAHKNHAQRRAWGHAPTREDAPLGHMAGGGSFPVRAAARPSATVLTVVPTADPLPAYEVSPMADRKFVKPATKTVVTRTEANVIKENAQNARKRGTPNDMIIARAAEEFHDRLEIIDEN